VNGTRTFDPLWEEEFAVTIIPILRRELVAAARKAQLQTGRLFFAGMLLTIVLGTFGAWYYWEHGSVSPQLMGHVARLSFLWIVLVHAISIFGCATTGALSIAGEKDRRTLDFLLATRLGNAEIVLGKLVSSLTLFISTLAAGLPIMLLLNTLGSIDLELILLTYASLTCMAFFLTSLSIWVSTGASDSGHAIRFSMLVIMAWLMLPFFVAFLFPRFGIRLPGFVLTINAWLLDSGPLSLLLKIGGGISVSSGLIDPVAWMGELQLLGGGLFLAWAIVRLRSAYRVNVSDDGLSLVGRLTRPGWRLRAKPAVSDDPILWREMTTSRVGFLSWVFSAIIISCSYAALGYITFFFGRPAFIELWRHGYTAGVTTADRPEMNLIVRYFLPDYGVKPPVDIARTEFNLFLRFVTTPTTLLIAVMAAGAAATGIATELARETWNSLIATPLTAREILRSKILAALWQLRWLMTTLFVLWTIGLIAGAIHPLGYLAVVIELAAWTWFFLTRGTLASVQAKDQAAATGISMRLAMLLTFSCAVPELLPARLSSVLLGAGSSPFVNYLSLVSYRDVRAAMHYTAYPPLQWIGLNTGEGPLWVVATCLIAIVAPALGGLYYWRYAVAHFDRLIDRPWRPVVDDEKGRELSNTVRPQFVVVAGGTLGGPSPR
jgi:ABC-type transport system involved in multi-copper enzyme maturation permease subunit